MRIYILFFRFLQIRSPSLFCFLCIIFSVFRYPSIYFTLPLAFFTGRMSVTYSTGDLNTVVLKLGILLLYVYHSFPSITHKNTPNTPTKAKKKPGSGYYSIHSRLWHAMSTYAREQLRLAKHRSGRKQRTHNCKHCQTI